MHGLGRALELAPTKDSAIPLLESYVNAFSGEAHTDKVLADRLIKLISDGSVNASVPLNHDETSAVFELLSKGKESDALLLEKKYLDNWQRVLLPISEEKINM